MSSLAKRTISAAILMPVFLIALFINNWLFYIVILLMLIIAWREWYFLILSKAEDKIKNTDKKLLIFGFVYIGLFALAQAWIFSHKIDGAWLILFVCAAVWATDIFAYFAGKAIGGAKMAPKISPNKTWAGLIGGVFGSVIVTSILAMPQFSISIFTGISIYMVAIIGIILAIADQTGDLLISAVKRKYGVKDTGNIIPGHGGILDRIDGLILSSILFAIILLFI